MSTDIHSYVEVRRDGRWEKVGRIFPNPGWREGDTIDEDPDIGGYRGPCTDEPYSDRNYDLFGMLAGVREPDIEPIVHVLPRGVPEDASPEFRAIISDYGDVCSSWVKLAELQAYDWDGPGGVHPEWDDPALQPKLAEYYARRAAMEALGQTFDHGWNEVPRPSRQRLHTRRELAGRFVTETMPQLAELGLPEDVRLVFFFV